MRTFLKTICLTLLAGAALQFVSCSGDDLGPTIFDTTEKPLDPNSFTFALDSFAKREFLEPYNLRFIYRMEDVGSDMDKNLTPAPYDKCVELAALTRYLWYDCYAQLAGEHEVFLKKYSPRIIHVIGSKNYNPTQGTETLGVAEGGIKITLYNVDNLDVSNISVMNEYFFKTMHHEFGHILDQTHLRPTAFNLVSNGKYDAMGWAEAEDSVTLGKGFVSPYASSAAAEDWVETLAMYITTDSILWNQMLNTASADWELVDVEDYTAYERLLTWGCDLDTIGYFHASESGSDNKVYRRAYERDADDHIVLDDNGKPIPVDLDGYNGRDVLTQKIEFVRQWLKENYFIDIDELRNMVQERTYVKNADGTWALDSHGRLVNRLIQPVEGYSRLIDQLTDQIYRISPNYQAADGQ